VLVLQPVYFSEVVTYIEDMRRGYNSKGAMQTYLSQGGFLPQEIVYEMGERGKQGGFLSSLNLPDVTVKPHRDMILLIGGTALILAAGAVGTAYVIKNR